MVLNSSSLSLRYEKILSYINQFIFEISFSAFSK